MIVVIILKHRNVANIIEMSGKIYFITGANRGIGFQLTTLLSSNPQNTIIGSARNPDNSPELSKLAEATSNIHIVKLDVSSQDSISGLSAQLEKVAPQGIDVFISNAGIADPKSQQPVIENTSWDSWNRHYVINALGPVFTTQAVYPHLLKKDTREIVFVSTLAASLSGFLSFSSSSYGSSKAALNHSVVSLASELKDQGFTVIALHPGVVATDMGKAVFAEVLKRKPELKELLEPLSITPEASVEGIVKVLAGLTKVDNGKFYSYDGSEIPY